MPTSRQDGKLEQVDPDEVADRQHDRRAAGREGADRRRRRRGHVQPQHQRADRREPAARGQGRRRGHQRLHQHDRRAEDPHDEGIRRIDGLEDPGPGRERQSSRKSRSEDFISKFARVYTPAVCYRGAGAGRLCRRWCGCCSWADPAAWADWIYRALTFLVISCPCALVISIPLSFFAGIGGASKAGVLVKGSNYLETLSQTKIVVFDKTGTLTQGVFEVSGIHHNELENDKLLEYAALAEMRLLAPDQQEPAAGLRQGDRPQPRVATSRRSAATASTAKVDGAARSPSATTS